MGETKLRLGIDLGGTKIEIVALGADDRPLLRRRVATPRHDYEATLAAIVALIADAEAALGRRGSVGLGIPGSLSPATGLVRNGNSTWLNGKPLGRDIETALCRPVRIANDANCLILSETADGAAAGAGVAFGIILGTGVGGGLAIAGRIVAGHNAIAGEWGHVPLPGRDAADGPPRPCWCGRTDCIETFLSGPALERDYAGTGDAPASGIAAATEIARRAAAGEAHAAAVMRRYEDRLARGLAAIVDIIDPDVIVVGGGLSLIPSLFDAVPPLLAPRVFSDVVTTRLVPARHGDSSGVLGAAKLWADHDA
ncbi:MAG: ROK family protein [Rhodospirillaceae bacterium]|nr:ROK family protein [Rhodospirillaceae bacterium]